MNTQPPSALVTVSNAGPNTVRIIVSDAEGFTDLAPGDEREMTIVGDLKIAPVGEEGGGDEPG